MATGHNGWRAQANGILLTLLFRRYGHTRWYVSLMPRWNRTFDCRLPEYRSSKSTRSLATAFTLVRVVSSSGETTRFVSPLQEPPPRPYLFLDLPFRQLQERVAFLAAQEPP